MDSIVLLPDWWLSNPWLCYGVGAYLSTAVGYFGSSLFLELLITQKFMHKYFITYKGSKSRASERDTIWRYVASWQSQVMHPQRLDARATPSKIYTSPVNGPLAHPRVGTCQTPGVL